MSNEVSPAILTAVLSLLGAGALALVNSWITARSGVDENLRSQRLEVYPSLWEKTAAVSVWPRNDPTRSDLEELHRSYRTWYYTSGGLFRVADRAGPLTEDLDTRRRRSLVETWRRARWHRRAARKAKVRIDRARSGAPVWS